MLASGPSGGGGPVPVRLAGLEDGFLVDGLHYLHIEGLEIRHYGSGDYGKGPVYVLRNVAWRVGNTRTFQQDGYRAGAIRINRGYPTPIGALFVYRNTFLTDAPATDAAATDAVDLLNPGASGYIRSLNNVIAGTRHALWSTPSPGAATGTTSTPRTPTVSCRGWGHVTTRLQRGWRAGRSRLGRRRECPECRRARSSGPWRSRTCRRAWPRRRFRSTLPPSAPRRPGPPFLTASAAGAAAGCGRIRVEPRRGWLLVLGYSM
jgi:hypothetical protein